MTTREEALEVMWAYQTWPKRNYEYQVGEGPHPGEWKQTFFYADLLDSVKMHEWNGQHPVEENTAIREVGVGTTVLVTVYSRLGDVGIRARNLDKVGNGYDARVNPEILDNWREAGPEEEKEFAAAAFISPFTIIKKTHG